MTRNDGSVADKIRTDDPLDVPQCRRNERVIYFSRCQEAQRPCPNEPRRYAECALQDCTLQEQEGEEHCRRTRLCDSSARFATIKIHLLRQDRAYKKKTKLQCLIQRIIQHQPLQYVSMDVRRVPPGPFRNQTPPPAICDWCPARMGDVDQLISLLELRTNERQWRCAVEYSEYAEYGRAPHGGTDTTS